jgi:hypothetical protein
MKMGAPEVQSEFPEYSLVYFASDGLSLKLEVSGGKLVAPESHIRGLLAMTSRGDGDIEPFYDAYVVCGLGLSSMRAVRTVSRTAAQWQIAGRTNPPTLEDIALGMEAPVRSSIALDVVSKLRQLARQPIFLIGTPLTAYERHASLWDKMKAKNKKRDEFLAAAYLLACKRVAQSYEATFVPQPAETIGPNALTTRPEFYRLAPEQVRVERAHHTHMNPAFGAIVLRDVMKRIDATLARPA